MIVGDNKYITSTFTFYCNDQESTERDEVIPAKNSISAHAWWKKYLCRDPEAEL